MKKLFPILLAFAFVLMACQPIEIPEEARVPNYTIAVFPLSGNADAMVLYASDVEWTDSGLNHVYNGEILQTFAFADASGICVTANDSDLTFPPTGGADCRTVDYMNSQAGTPIVEMPNAVYEAIALPEADISRFTQDQVAKTAGFLAIFSDVNGDPIAGVSLRSAFMTLNRNDVNIITDRGIVNAFPVGAESVCIYINDTVNAMGIRECMPLHKE